MLVDREEDATIRVMVVDDHEVVREGLRTIFRTEPDIVLVGEASSSTECLSKIKELVPDVILMDVRMPDGDGFSAVNEIRKLFPKIHVIMLTGYDSSLYVSEALDLGVKGFITKNCPKRLVCNAIRTVRDGGSVWEGELLYDAFRGLHHRSRIEIKGSANASSLKTSEQLNPRETEIARLIIDGQTNQGIAIKLGVSVETVKKSIRNIMDKLKVSNRTQLAITASRLGLV